MEIESAVGAFVGGPFVHLGDSFPMISFSIAQKIGKIKKMSEKSRKIRLEYKVGIAETFKENQTARRLLSEAIRNKKEFVSESLEK